MGLRHDLVVMEGNLVVLYFVIRAWVAAGISDAGSPVAKNLTVTHNSGGN